MVDFDYAWMDINVTFMDVYFLRRFLDKKYITNTVTYTGINHSINYIYALVKYFDFKITHASYMKYDIKEATKKIKNSDTTLTDVEAVDIRKI